MQFVSCKTWHKGSWSTLSLEVRQMIIKHFVDSSQAITITGRDSRQHVESPKLSVLASVSYSFGHDDCMKLLYRAGVLARKGKRSLSWQISKTSKRRKVWQAVCRQVKLSVAVAEIRVIGESIKLAYNMLLKQEVMFDIFALPYPSLVVGHIC